MSERIKWAGLSDMDPRLLEEAFRRAMRASDNRGVEPDAVLAAILSEARAGTRHMFGLVAAGQRVSR
jgi:hypothetical protein